MSISGLKSAVDDIMQQIYRDVDLSVCKRASRAERESAGKLGDVTLTYGEIEVPQFVDILLPHARSLPSPVFLDAGAGVGRPVAVAALLLPVVAAHGYESIKSLVASGQEPMARTREVLSSLGRTCEVLLEERDFTAISWKPYGLVFANSTCYDDALMERIGVRAVDLQLGAVLITFTQPVGPQAPWLKLHGEGTCMTMSWGHATVYVHERVHCDEVDGAPVSPRGAAPPALSSDLPVPSGDAADMQSPQGAALRSRKAQWYRAAPEPGAAGRAEFEAPDLDTCSPPRADASAHDPALTSPQGTALRQAQRARFAAAHPRPATWSQGAAEAAATSPASMLPPMSPISTPTGKDGAPLPSMHL